MFRLIDQSSSGLLCRLSHKVLCTHWDPSVYTSTKYKKSDQSDLILCILLMYRFYVFYWRTDQSDFVYTYNQINLISCIHKTRSAWSDFMYFIDVQISLILCILFMYRFYIYIKPDQPDLILCILLMYRFYEYIKPHQPDLILCILLMYRSVWFYVFYSCTDFMYT